MQCCVLFETESEAMMQSVKAFTDIYIQDTKPVVNKQAASSRQPCKVR